jgi:hypothetical protein
VLILVAFVRQHIAKAQPGGEDTVDLRQGHLEIRS